MANKFFLPDEHGLFNCKNFYRWHKKCREANPLFQELWTKCLYDVLGVERGASVENIKREFRKKARQHHPDKGGDPEKFKELQEAYEILCDTSKRKIYDELGEQGLEKGAGSTNKYSYEDADEIKKENKEDKEEPRSSKKGIPVVQKLSLSLEEVYAGTTKKLPIKLTKLCPCQSVEKIEMEQLGGEQTMCSVCKGRKTVTIEETISVNIPAGIASGQRLILRGSGNQEVGAIAGDIVVVVAVSEHADVKVSGQDVFYVRDLSFQEAMGGFRHEMKHLDEQEIHVCSVHGRIYKSGDVQLMRGKGLPTCGDPGVYGNMYVEFTVQFPSSLGKLANLQRQKSQKKRGCWHSRQICQEEKSGQRWQIRNSSW